MEDKITFEEVYYCENDKLWYKTQFLNGLKHGEELTYWFNGKLDYKRQYLNGKLHGEQLSYHFDGKLWYKEYYINGDEVSQGEWIKYNRNVKLNVIWNKVKIK